MSDRYNMSMRKFLKQVGVTSQQEIEAAIRAAEASGKSGPFKARMVLTLEGADLNHVVEGEIRAEQA